MTQIADIKIDLYSEQDHSNWLDLIHKVQSQSDAWEAVYLNHPRFDLDYCVYRRDQLIGILAGHHIDQSQAGNIYSIEIFAIDPEQQGLGLGKSLLKDIWDHHPNLGGLIFWTTSQSSKKFYESMGLYLRHSQSLKRSAWQEHQGYTFQSWETSNEPRHNLFEYIMTRQHLQGK